MALTPTLIVERRRSIRFVAEEAALEMRECGCAVLVEAW